MAPMMRPCAEVDVSVGEVLNLQGREWFRIPRCSDNERLFVAPVSDAAFECSLFLVGEWSQVLSPKKIIVFWM